MTKPVQPVEPIMRLEPYHRELTHYAARMLGSRFEAEDAVQDTMMRAWNALDRFEGRSQLRSWLYRICTNVCLDMLASRQRQALPMDLRPGRHAVAMLEASHSAAAPSSMATVVPSDGDPADVAVARESVRLALITVLQHLPPKQRAVLILREALHWSASEVAELLDTSVASVNSALQRARATLRGVRAARDTARPADEVAEETHTRLSRYVQALESSDMETLAALLVKEAA